jgi:hypothetical protein
MYSERQFSVLGSQFSVGKARFSALPILSSKERMRASGQTQKIKLRAKEGKIKFFNREPRTENYCCGFAGGGVPDAGLFVVVPVAGLGTFFFAFLTGFSGSVSSTTVFFAGAGGAAWAAARAVRRRLNSASFPAARL